MAQQQSKIDNGGSCLVLQRRPATSSDFDFARRAHHAAYHDVVVRQFGQWSDEVQDRFFNEDWASGPSDMIMCNGVCCGYCRIAAHVDCIVGYELVILPKFQCKGIGTALLQQVIGEAEQQGIAVKIKALKENRALELYYRLGFKAVGSSATHIDLEYRPMGVGGRM